MMKKIEGEKWKVLDFHKSAYGKSYAISNMGRLCAFNKKVNDGDLLKGSLQEGYPIWRFRKVKRNGVIGNYGILIHRLVAQNFLKAPKKDQTLVIHLNYKKTDNRKDNLSWATVDEASAHSQKSPIVIKHKKERKEMGGFATNAKLTEKEVKQIKQALIKNETLKQIATRFGISDMQVYRIKTGENWSHVKS